MGPFKTWMSSLADRATRRARFYRRAVGYFRDDWRLLVAWLALIGIATGLSLLAAWPMAILIDSVLAPSAATHADWIHRLFLGVLPRSSKVGQIMGLAVA